MTTYDIVQTLVLAAAIGASVAYALRQYFPKGLRQRLGAWLQQPQRAHWLQGVGAWLMPVAAKSGCDSGCGSCGGCGSKDIGKAEQPLVFSAQGSPRKS
ncbi:MAG: DUF6587 family protein [Stenotrophobium sp.]